jgi:hypothetical protein
MIHGIDRASFLALTFGMAGVAGACNVGGAPVAPGAVVEIPPQPPQPDAGPSEVARKPDETKLRATPTPDEPAPVAASDDDDDPGDPTAEGGSAAASPPATCGFVDPACSMMKGCSGFTFPRQKCEAYRRFFKPKVAQKALDCLGRLKGSQVCDACSVYRCGDLAMKGSCPDPAVNATCALITSKCKSVKMAECQRYLSGLNAAGRQKMTACLTSASGCGFGIFSCAEGIF